MADLDNCSLMNLALEEARQAERIGEVPVGAVLVVEDRMFKGFNRTITSCDPTAHAEMVVMREAAQSLGNYRLTGARLVVTLEPCMMCAGAIVHARIAQLVFGAYDLRYGAAGSFLNAFDLGLNHKPEIIGGVLAEECGTQLKRFFLARR